MSYQQAQLGVAPALVAGEVIGAVGSIFGGGTPKQRPAQLAANANLYGQATGNPPLIGALYALSFLAGAYNGGGPFPETAQYRGATPGSADYGQLITVQAGGGTGQPWGDGVVQHDAINKYRQARSVLESRGWTFSDPSATAVAHPPQSQVNATVPGTAITPAGLPGMAGLLPGVNQSTLPLLVGGGVVLYLLSQRR
jgi:hypothetical protein